LSAIFINHSSRGNNFAAELRARLQEQGYRSLFLDFDPTDGIPTGRHWEQELYAQLRVCRAVAVLCSEHSMASDWCFAEITHARALGKHILSLKIAPCSIRPVLRDIQIIDLTTEREEGFERLWRGLKKAGLDLANAFDWDGSRRRTPVCWPSRRRMRPSSSAAIRNSAMDSTCCAGNNALAALA
jgi:hypothetical protein